MKCCAVILAALLLLAGCSANSESASFPESSAAEESVLASSDPASDVSSESAAEVKIIADELRPANNDPLHRPDNLLIDSSGEQFYTMQRDGLWGLCGEDGREILPCTAEEPVDLCSKFHWVWGGLWQNTDEDMETRYKRFDAEVREATGRPLCDGHGGGNTMFWIDLDSDSPLPLGHARSEGSAVVFPFDEEDNPPEDPYFPVMRTTMFWGEVGEELEDGGWNFANAQGELLHPDGDFTCVGWFNGEALAPVEQDGRWAYLNAEGELVTDFVYESCWGSDWLMQDDGHYHTVTPLYAYGLWGGYAPVCREGRWGVLDKNGNEIVPCEFDGAAPYPGGAWLKEGDCWTLTRFD